jgi:glycolate oxidase
VSETLRPSWGPVDSEVLGRLEAILGRTAVVSDPEKLEAYGHDEFSLAEIARVPDVVVKPDSTERVAAVLALADERRIPVTPRGGGTGLCGGCVPARGGIVLSLEKMNRIRDIDRDNRMAVAEAGVTLKEFAAAVEEAGFSFPPHPGDENAMVGGLVATNAGGSRAVKYGGIRRYVLGLEVVLPGGAVIRPGGKLIKSSTGYNLLNLLIGSEGTLGVITAATIQVLPPLRATRSLIVPFADIDSAVASVNPLLNGTALPLAVEFIGREVIEITEKHLDKKWPSALGRTYLLIILDAADEGTLDRLSEEAAEVCRAQGGLEVFVADSPRQQERVLEIRSKIYEAIKSQTVEILDISLPRAEIPGHVRRIGEVERTHGLWLPTFGHAADGNIHTHIMKARFEKGALVPLPEEAWRTRFDLVRSELYDDALARGGVISGEHGIGLVKKAYLARCLGPDQVGLMKGLKRVFDPRGILNPGKIFDEA